LNVFPLAIAPLRLRRDDVLPLAMQLLSGRCRPGTQIPALGADAAHLLLTYPWPGNVRELDNLLQRALILVNGPVIHKEHVQFELANDGGAAEPVTLAVKPAPVDTTATGSFAALGSAAASQSAASSLARSLDQTERDLIPRAISFPSPGAGGKHAAVTRRHGWVSASAPCATSSPGCVKPVSMCPRPDSKGHSP
jgi:two-component system response regulator FlrC